jgi:hypothetical protein
MPRDRHEGGVQGQIDACKELGMAMMAYAVLGRGMLSAEVRKVEELAADDVLAELPRFHSANVICWLGSLPARRRLRRQSLRRHCQMLSAQGRNPSAARESVGRLAITGAEQIFSLAWNPVKGRLRLSADNSDSVTGRSGSSLRRTAPPAHCQQRQSPTCRITPVNERP